MKIFHDPQRLRRTERHDPSKQIQTTPRFRRSRSHCKRNEKIWLDALRFGYKRLSQIASPLSIIDRDLLAYGEAEIKDAQVLRTCVAGERVYGKGS